MKIQHLLAAISIMALSACASGKAAKERQAAFDADMLKFKAGEYGAIVMNASGKLDCDRYYLGVGRKGDAKNKVFSFKGDKSDTASEIGIQPVAPGAYRINRGTCYKYGYTGGSLPLLDKWFFSFDVKPGEVVYPGTIDMESVSVSYSGASTDNVLVSIFTKKKNRVGNKTFVSYEMQDNSSDVKAKLLESHPELAEKITYRPPFALLSADGYRNAQKKAYAPDADGKPPTAEVAQERFKSELDTLIQDSLTRLIEEATPDTTQTKT